MVVQDGSYVGARPLLLYVVIYMRTMLRSGVVGGELNNLIANPILHSSAKGHKVQIFQINIM